MSDLPNRIVPVELGRNSYDIHIGYGIMPLLGEHIAASHYSGRGLLVTDSNIGPHYAGQVRDLCRAHGLDVAICTVPAGEPSKCLTQAEELYTKCIEHRLDRRSPIIALGGGVVGDLAGFIAATYMRGVPFIQIPTSLLAQVDSSVGGKVAVNHRLGKNLIGAFYQPRTVIMDLSLLDTLPEREIYTGLGEIIKYGIIYDEPFFRFLEQNREAILAREHSVMQPMIARCCEIKAAVVSQDEREAGLRRILNFGHTIGHAIEKETNYERYNHGEAVAIGMVGAADISCQLGLTERAVYDRIVSLIKAMHLPTQAEGCTAEAMLADTLHDKKTIGGQVNWVLVDEIGKVSCHNDVPADVVHQAMHHLGAR